MVQKVCDASCALFNSIDQIIIETLRKLHRYTAGPSGYYRLFLPERFRNDQTESFANRFLNHDVAPALKDINLHASHPRYIGKNEQIRISCAFFLNQVQQPPALRIVTCHRPYERQLNTGNLALHDAIRLYDSERILPRIKSRYLQKQRPLEVDPGIRDRAAAQFDRKIDILGGERIDGRSNKAGACLVEPREQKGGHREDESIILIDVGGEKIHNLHVRR